MPAVAIADDQLAIDRPIGGNPIRNDEPPIRKHRDAVKHAEWRIPFVGLARLSERNREDIAAGEVIPDANDDG